MNDIYLEQIPNMKIDALWDMFLIVNDETNIPQQTFLRVKYGYNIAFDIRLYIRYLLGVNVGIREELRAQRVNIFGNIYSATDWFDEIDQRVKTMKQKLTDYYSEEQDVTQSRITVNN